MKAAQMAVDWWAERLKAGDVEAFKKALYPLVLNDLQSYGECILECDYDPKGHLLTAVRAAGLKCTGSVYSAYGILPTKHELYVYPDRIEPKEGYANWTETIFVKNDTAGQNSC